MDHRTDRAARKTTRQRRNRRGAGRWAASCCVCLAFAVDAPAQDAGVARGGAVEGPFGPAGGREGTDGDLAPRPDGGGDRGRGARRPPFGARRDDVDRLPVRVPPYALDLGLFPAFYAPHHATRSTAVVVVHYPPARRDGADVPGGTRVYGTAAAGRTTEVPLDGEHRPPYDETVSRALAALNATEQAAEFMREGTARFGERDYAGAAEAFRRAAPLVPDNALPRFAFAQALFALGDYAAAAHNLAGGFERMPEFAASGHDLRALYAEPKDFDEQLVALRAHVSMRPSDLDARLVLGHVSFFSGDLDGAREVCTALAADATRADEDAGAAEHESEPPEPPAAPVARLLLEEILRVRATSDSSE